MARRRSPKGAARAGPDPSDAFDIVFFAPTGAADAPGSRFLEQCPVGVRADLRNTVIAVAKAPPHKFAGGGKWEAMKGDMSGFYEVRCNGPGRQHYRLFCILDRSAIDPATKRKSERGYLVILCGGVKRHQTTFPDHFYADVRSKRDAYLSTNPRSSS